MSEAVIEAWKQILASAEAGQRLLPGNSLHLYFGADHTSRPVFFLVTELSSRAPKLAELVQVEHGRRPDGKWTVVLTLKDTEFLETFMGMCLELARRTSTAENEADGLAIFDETIKQWRRLLTYKGARRLTEQEAQGLAAELWFLLELSASVESPSIAVDAWKGPLGAPHDFRVSSAQMFEVKAIRGGAASVHISSLEQLETESDEQLELVLVTINDSSDMQARSTLSLIQLVAAIRKRLNGDEIALDSFETKLALIQFDPTDQYYASRGFEVVRSRHFAVRDDFPRIRKDSAPLGVVRARYQLEIAALNAFFVPNGLSDQAAHGMRGPA
ncbi:PD-(D/E)XK motif protein [Agromyces cerinus]|uniref:PD-(D/E)XK motif protein n=1 Tax=Agromyces cerinus TaxID=33878 RepID=UPI00135628B0|nr:PD-(D/E)XK motif protein [Agromyces cerinus]